MVSAQLVVQLDVFQPTVAVMRIPHRVVKQPVGYSSRRQSTANKTIPMAKGRLASGSASPLYAIPVASPLRGNLDNLEGRDDLVESNPKSGFVRLRIEVSNPLSSGPPTS